MKIRFDVLPDYDSYKVNYQYIPRIGEKVDFNIFEKNNTDCSEGVVIDVYYSKDIIIIQVKGISEK